MKKEEEKKFVDVDYVDGKIIVREEDITGKKRRRENKLSLVDFKIRDTRRNFK